MRRVQKQMLFDKVSLFSCLVISCYNIVQANTGSRARKSTSTTVKTMVNILNVCKIIMIYTANNNAQGSEKDV